MLGTAAGGGLPQWNCACTECEQARRTGYSRTQDCLVISGDEQSWYLVNASPDIRVQVLNTPELRPGPGERDTPLCGVLLSTAELDHALGLFTLREAEDLVVYSSATVAKTLSSSFPLQAILGCYTNLTWNVVAAGEPVRLKGGLTATAVPVGSKRPRYANPDAGDEWAVAYRITDARTGGSLVYAPCLPEMEHAVLSLIEDADCVLLDGTFFHASEMARQTGVATSRQQNKMGHLPIDASIPLIVSRPGPRYLYTHLNNTNPAAAPGTHEERAVTASGAEIASDGQVLTL